MSSDHNANVWPRVCSWNEDRFSLELFSLLPLVNRESDRIGDLRRSLGLAVVVHEAAVGVDGVDDDGVVDDVVVVLIPGSGGEVDPVGLAGLLDLLLGASEAHHARVELLDVLRDLLGPVPIRIDRDEERDDLQGSLFLLLIGGQIVNDL